MKLGLNTLENMDFGPNYFGKPILLKFSWNVNDFNEQNSTPESLLAPHERTHFHQSSLEGQSMMGPQDLKCRDTKAKES